MKDETMQDLMSAGEIGVKYDQAAKALWRNREILAPLLKYAVTELSDLSVKEIMGLIDGDSISEGTAVSDLPPIVASLATEYGSVTEKVIYYDYKFNVTNPQLSCKPILILIHVDLEFQNKYRPTLPDGKSYPLIKRGIYYAAREISSQLGRVTGQTNYADLEKVVSIWIVNEGVPKEIRNTATRYYIQKSDFIGSVDEPRMDYDLMEVVIIRRGEADDITDPLFQYLKGVYDADIEVIDQYTPASDNPTIKEEVAIYNKGYDQGMSAGYNQGVSAGYDQGMSVGYDQGVSTGYDQGQSMLIQAVGLLRAGNDHNAILSLGIDEKTIELAEKII